MRTSLWERFLFIKGNLNYLIGYNEFLSFFGAYLILFHIGQKLMGKEGITLEQKLHRDRRIGDNLRILRDRYDISQEKLCAELQRRGCDIGRTTYAKYEAGE